MKRWNITVFLIILHNQKNLDINCCFFCFFFLIKISEKGSSLKKYCSIFCTFGENKQTKTCVRLKMLKKLIITVCNITCLCLFKVCSSCVFSTFNLFNITYILMSESNVLTAKYQTEMKYWSTYRQVAAQLHIWKWYSKNPFTSNFSYS